MPAPGSTMGILADLVDGRLTGDPDTAVSDVTHDSRQVAARLPLRGDQGIPLRRARLRQ